MPEGETDGEDRVTCENCKTSIYQLLDFRCDACEYHYCQKCFFGDSSERYNIETQIKNLTEKNQKLKDPQINGLVCIECLLDWGCEFSTN
jgi:predicted sulfurtransferase